MIVAGTVAGVMLAVMALLVTVRVVRGPSVLDRVVGTDTLLAAVLCGLGLYAAVTRDSTVVPVMVVVALVGFIGSAAVGRLIPPDRRVGPDGHSLDPGPRLRDDDPPEEL